MSVYRRYPPPRRRRPFVLSAPPTTGSATVSIGAGIDDAYESNTGAVTLYGTSLNVNTTDSPWVILLFRDLPIPAGATLTNNTKIEVVCTTYADPGLTIAAEASLTPATPSTTANSISSRTVGAQTVTWSASNLGTSGYVQSPSVASVVEEWKALGGYTQGASDIAFILHTTGSGHIRFFSRDNGANYPRLYLEWTTAGGTTHEATAVDAWGAAESLSRWAIYRQTAADSLDTTEARVARGVYRPTAVETLGLLAALAPRRVLQAAVVESMGVAGGMGPQATWRPVLAELLELLEAAGGGGRIPAAAADTLDVTATAGPGWTLRRTAADAWQLTETAARQATTRPTAADALELTGTAAYPLTGESGELHLLPNADGIEAVADGAVSLTTTSFNVNSTQMYAAKWDNLDIPQGAAIETSDIEFYILTYDDPGLTARAQLSAAPGNLTTANYDISGRELGEAAAAWSAANVGSNQVVHTPDLAEVIQEIVDLPEWERGVSSLVLVLKDAGTGGWLRGQTVDSTTKPYLNLRWRGGGLLISVATADGLALLESAERRAILAAATADSAAWTAATTVTLSLLLAEAWQLGETVLTLARLTVDDAALLGDGVYLTYALSLSEPLALHVALQRIATARAAPVDAVAYSDAMRTVVNTSAGDALTLTDALAARRLLAALTADAVAYGHLLSGDIPGLLDAIAQERIDLSGAAAAGWRGRVAAGDALAVEETLATLRRFLGAAADGELLGDVAAFVKRARPTAADAAGLADALRARMGTRAADGLAWSDATVAQLLTILRAIAADGLALDEGMAVAWRVTARDGLEFAAALATIMRWVAAVSDEWGVRGVAAFLLPNGIVRIELAMMKASVAFEIAMPRADVALRQPAVVIEPHGLMDR